MIISLEDGCECDHHSALTCHRISWRLRLPTKQSFTAKDAEDAKKEEGIEKSGSLPLFVVRPGRRSRLFHHLSDLQNAKKEPCLRVIDMLATALGVSMSDLLKNI